MARTDSWAGLNPRATALVDKAKVVGEKEFWGLCNPFALRSFRLPDGSAVHEVIQESVWDGGPTWFVALANDDGTILQETAWTDQEIADHMGFEYNGALPAISPAEAGFFAHFRDEIEDKRIRLDWSLEQKYRRWRATCVS